MHNADRLFNYLNTATADGESWIDSLTKATKLFQPVHAGWLASDSLTADKINAYGILHSDLSTSIYIFRLHPTEIYPLTFAAHEVGEAIAFSALLMADPAATLAKCDLAQPGD